MNTEVNGRIYQNNVQKKLRTGESEQNRTQIAEGRSFVYLVLLIKFGYCLYW